MFPSLIRSLPNLKPQASNLATSHFLSHCADTLGPMSYRCASCGYTSGKWMGFCPGCNVAEPLAEEIESRHRRVAAPSWCRSARSATAPRSGGMSVSANWTGFWGVGSLPGRSY